MEEVVPLDFPKGSKAAAKWSSGGNRRHWKGGVNFLPISVLMARAQREGYSDKIIQMFVAGRDNPEFAPVILVLGLVGTGKTVFWCLVLSILFQSPRFKLCLYKCSQALLDKLIEKWKKFPDLCAGWDTRVYRAMTIGEIQVDSLVVCDEGLLGLHGNTALRTEMRKLGGYLAEVRQRGSPVIICAQTENVVAEVRRHVTIAMYKKIAVMSNRKLTSNPVELEYAEWLKTNDGKQFTLVDDGYGGTGMGILQITKADLDEAIPWFDADLSTYMRSANPDMEDEWRREILKKIIEVSDGFFTRTENGAEIDGTCVEPGVTPERLLSCKAGWLRAYYQRYEPEFLDYLINGTDNYVQALADQIAFVAKCLAWADEDTPDEDETEAETEMPEVFDAAAVASDPESVSFGQFLRQHLAANGAHFFKKSGISAQVEHQIVSSIADGTSQRAVVKTTGVDISRVNRIWLFYWGHEKKKKDRPFAPHDLQVPYLYELWDCFKTGGTHDGGNGAPDNLLPDGRFGTCKCYNERRDRLTFSIQDDFGPELKHALEQHQTTIRVSIRNIDWIKNYPDTPDWISVEFSIDHHPDGTVVDDKIILHPKHGFLRPDGTPFFAPQLTC